MREFSLEISDNFVGCEIKYILKTHFGFSDRLITGLKKGNNILLNGKKEYVVKIVEKGDILTIILPENPSENIIPEDIPLEILYEDDDILAVNKPYDMPTHPSHGHFTGTLANAVMHYFRNIPFTFRAVTRLDRDTSGVVIIAKNAPSHNTLSKFLASGEFQKEYLALTCGIPQEKEGIIDAPIAREMHGAIKRCINPLGKKAVTYYKVIEEKDDYALVSLLPKTGRTHQLRLHLAHIGTPIYADFLYGKEVPDERTRLHCKRVTFPHPFTNEIIEITAPCPCDMNFEKF